jgi:membrane fusion protein (multidrug efflux system)
MRLSLPSDRSLQRKILFGAGIAGLLTVGTLYALAKDDKSKPEKAAVVYELASADVLTVHPQSLTRSLRLSGSLAPLRHTVVKSHTVGTLLEMRVAEGDRVRKGATLARIDSRNLTAELDSRTASLRKAQADALLAKKNRDNSTVLLDRKLISQNAFDQTVAAFDVAVANEEAAKAQVRLAENALHDSEIRAEFDGVVATRNVQAGERVMPDSPLLTLIDLSKMQLEALVPVADVPSIKVGQTARFKVDGFGDREFTGQVERINPQTQQGTRSLTIYVTVANSDGALKGGMFAEGDLVLQETAPLLAIPNAAVRQDNEGQYVLAVQNEVIARAPVVARAPYADSQMTVIEQGLNDSDQVIVAPASTLKPGARVKLSATL